MELMNERTDVTFVLVHGGGSGAWTWHLVTEELAKRDLDSVAIDLPSSNAPDNTAGPREDAASLRDVINGIEGPVILVGNSYGGFVISEAAAGHPAVERLVFLSAIMPDPGRPLMDIITEVTVPNDELGLTFLDDGRIVFDAESDLRSSFQLAPEAEVDYIRQHLARPMSLGTVRQPSVDNPAWQTIPSTYIVCTQDRALRVEAQRAWAKERATDYHELPVDHCPQHSHPGLVVDILEGLAR
jgi:pimeloyl-ACP methyl ester carboxylesterase